jgi:Icc-related predicted phosphoesterase
VIGTKVGDNDMRLFRTKTGQTERDVLRLYYASDVHGSERCWRKFLNAAAAYDVSALVMGGDLTGKAIVPVERREHDHVARFLGDTRVASDPKELEELLDAIRFNGMYPWIAERGEIERYAAGERDTDELFDEIIAREISRWVELADERGTAAGAGVFVMAGNDDPWVVDDVLRTGRETVFCDARIVEVGGHELLSCSYANPTPWSSPRELPEDALYDRIGALAEQLSSPSTAIFNLHVPPHASGLDSATQIDDELRPVTSGGEPVTVPVGSTAVRELIEEYQPLLSLHGHVHESRGVGTIGRTAIVNPGSEYGNGTIHGAIVALAPDRVVTRQLVVG